MGDVDIRFHQLKNHILNMRNIQASTIANLAIDHVNDLSTFAAYWSAVDKFKLLDALADKADKIEAQAIER